MNAHEVNEDQDTASAEQRVQNATAGFAHASGQMMQAMAQVAGGIVGTVAGAMTAPLTVAGTVGAQADEPDQQFGEGEQDDDGEDIQQQRQRGGGGPQPTSGSEPAQQG